jgi:hypothetical protein
MLNPLPFTITTGTTNHVVNLASGLNEGVGHPRDSTSGTTMMLPQHSSLPTTSSPMSAVTKPTRRYTMSLISHESDSLVSWIQTVRKPWHMASLLPAAKRCFRTSASSNLAYKLDVIVTTGLTILIKAKFETDALFTNRTAWDNTRMIWMTPAYVSNYITTTSWYDQELAALPDEFEATRAAPNSISLAMTQRIGRQIIIDMVEAVHLQEPTQAARFIMETMPFAIKQDVDDLMALILKTTTVVSTEALAHGLRTDIPSGSRVEVIESMFSDYLKRLD